MKSWWFVPRNNSLVLEMRDAPEPRPGQGQVVVKVHAAGMNRGELIVGGVLHAGAEKIGGIEAAGTVHALGVGVKAVEVGDRVMGSAAGGFAEFTVMDEGHVMPVPSGWSWEQAAAAPTSYLIAYEAIVREGDVGAGDWVLIAGASSGVGVGAIQIARLVGARTIGTSRSAAKLARLRSLGLDVDVRTEGANLLDEVRAATNGEGVALAVNLVGGTMFADCLHALKRQGRLAVIGYVDRGYSATIDLAAVHAQRLRVFGLSNSRRAREEKIEVVQQFVRDMLPQIESGAVFPVVDRVFEFDELAEARAYFEADAMVGKVVIRVEL